MLDVQITEQNISNSDPSWIEVLSDMGVGLLLYDGGGRLLRANDLVHDYLGPDLEGDRLAHLRNFVEYMFDHSVPMYECPSRVKEKADQYGRHRGDFYELIQGAGSRYLLCSLRILQDGRRAVFLSDMGHPLDVHRTTDDLPWQHYALLQAVEHGETGVALYDPQVLQQPVVFVNRAFCRMLQMSREDVLGKNWHNILPDMKGHQNYRVVKQIVDGHSVVYGCQVSALEDLGIVFMSDITALSDKDDQMRHMQKLEQLGQLAGGVAHDFNNILGIVRGYGHILQRHFGKDEKVANALASILKACERGSSLTDKLLAFSRKRINDPMQIKFKRAMGMLESMLRILIPPSISFDVFVPDQDLLLMCSEDHLMQMIMNLVINARDASKDGGEIRVDCNYLSGRDLKDQWPDVDVDRHYIKMVVSDKGSGMSPDVLKHIYEPFFSTKETGKGSGLGLAVVYGLVQQYAGHIMV